MDHIIAPISDAMAALSVWQPATITDGLTNTPVLVATGNRNVYGWTFENPNGTTMYIQFFNKAAAGSVTLGTTVPDHVLPVPAGGFADDLLAIAIKNFPLGVVIAATTTEKGSTAPGSVIKVPTVFYK